MLKILMIIVATMTVGACSSGRSLYGDTPQQPSTLCEDPRPEMCTFHYDPVCAEHADGSWQTHANACTACSDPAVTGYLPNACRS